MLRLFYNMGTVWANAAGWLVLGCTLCVAGCQTLDNKLNMGSSFDEKADIAFDEGADKAPYPKTLLAGARILAVQHRDAECVYILTRLIRDHPRFLPAYCDLAEIQMRNRQFDEALKTLSAGLEKSPEDPILLNNLGMCWMLKGSYETALVAFTRAVAGEPDNTRYRANMAMVLGMMGRYEEALSLYEQMISAPDAQHNLAVLYRARKHLLVRTNQGNELLPSSGKAEANPSKDRSLYLSEFKQAQSE
ncbi:MAG: tetratricopeptide repeat protein [Planctomycetota bacterium]|jgi:Flp pilus assembly protein TadD